MHNVPSKKKKKIKPPPPTTKKNNPPTHTQKTSTTTKPPTNPKKNPKKPHPKNIKMQSLVSQKIYVGSTPQQVLHILSLSPLYKSDLEGNFKKNRLGTFWPVFYCFSVISVSQLRRRFSNWCSHLSGLAQSLCSPVVLWLWHPHPGPHQHWAAKKVPPHPALKLQFE